MTRCGQKSTKSAEWMADRIAWEVKAEKVWGVEGVGIRGGAYSQQFRSWRACYTGSARWGRAGRGGTTCTNLRLSSPVPLTGVCQPADAAGGGTAPVPTGGGGQPRGGLSYEHSRVGVDPPLGRPSWHGNQLHSPCFQVPLNDEQDRNETEAQTLKLFAFIVHSLVDMDRSINVMGLVYRSRYSRRVTAK